METTAAPVMEKGESSVHCFVCQQPDHYATQCPRRDKGKGPTVNTITTDIKQVITRSQAKSIEWVEQEDIRKATQDWVEKANLTNAKRIRQESANTAAQREDTTMTPDPVWLALAECEITMSMDKLLRLVLRF